jgi:hypothetical protein
MTVDVPDIGTTAADLELRHEIRFEFHPERMRVPWNQCAATASFVAEELAAIVEREALGDGDSVRTTADYVLNELIENAVKFGHRGRVLVRAGLADVGLCFEVGNEIDSDAVEPLSAVFRELVDCDPMDAIVARVESNFATEAKDSGAGGDAGSGLGFLTIRSDHGAELGFRFIPSQDVPGGRLLLSSAIIATP